MTASAAELVVWHEDARARTLALMGDLDGSRLLGPKLAIVNPPLWEFGHVAWFHERWAWRHLRARPALRDDGDRLYDSAAVAHDTRWELPLPSLLQTHEYARTILARIIDELLRQAPSPEVAYYHRLGVLHEDMHGEAFASTWQTLGYPAPKLPAATTPIGAPDWTGGDVEVQAGAFSLGADPTAGFVFDNEKWAHPVTLAPFRMARAAVSNADFVDFVGAGGYVRREFWCAAGWAWRQRVHAEHPVYWRRAGSAGWEQRSFDTWRPLRGDHPVIHVCWYEANAYCQWARRRLPAEAEWEAAAAGVPQVTGARLSSTKRLHPWGDDAPTLSHANLDAHYGGTVPVSALPAGDSASGCRQMYGNVWEWTATDFAPYPGFHVDPYQEYSAPWFHTHKVLRGGAWTTRARLMRNTWRNFYTPDRRDVFAGFRTCAV